ncbi:8-oxo-dGTP diphosphatase [Prevotella sp. ne3005]|uniref:NUDIX domain-containing protein n=1 Tax=Prevotella sp. ne3005 TaxID=1761887 RepID=UPI0008B0F3BA|nr:NUDIX hydrolase [Prevotella sp. ne3005]SEN05625.1 8-oxo-dGTP diphosphatase [Prevotella sp. ne3005]
MAYTYKYPRPAVTADCIVITREAEPKVLLIQRGDEPFKGGWAFPGGFMNMDETTELCAIRELEEETGLRVSDVHQIGAYSKVDRDPRGRTITVAYLAIIDEPIAVTGQDDAAKAEWWPLSDFLDKPSGIAERPHLAFDHYDIMQDAIRLYAQVVEESEKTQHDRFKEQKERMHELSKQIREQCAHVQDLCSNFTKKQ